MWSPLFILSSSHSFVDSPNSNPGKKGLRSPIASHESKSNTKNRILVLYKPFLKQLEVGSLERMSLFLKESPRNLTLGLLSCR
jgi:hypothetical protein